MITRQNYNTVITSEIVAKFNAYELECHNKYISIENDLMQFPELYDEIQEVKQSVDNHIKFINEISGKLSLNSISDNLSEIFTDENERSIARMFINQRAKGADITTRYILQMASKMGISQPHVYVIRGKLIDTGLIPEDWVCQKINRGGRPKK